MQKRKNKNAKSRPTAVPSRKARPMCTPFSLSLHIPENCNSDKWKMVTTCISLLDTGLMYSSTKVWASWRLPTWSNTGTTQRALTGHGVCPHPDWGRKQAWKCDSSRFARWPAERPEAAPRSHFARWRPGPSHRRGTAGSLLPEQFYHQLLWVSESLQCKIIILKIHYLNNFKKEIVEIILITSYADTMLLKTKVSGHDLF